MFTISDEVSGITTVINWTPIWDAQDNWLLIFVRAKVLKQLLAVYGTAAHIRALVHYVSCPILTQSPIVRHNKDPRQPDRDPAPCHAASTVSRHMPKSQQTYQTVRYNSIF